MRENISTSYIPKDTYLLVRQKDRPLIYLRQSSRDYDPIHDEIGHQEPPHYIAKIIIRSNLVERYYNTGTMSKVLDIVEKEWGLYFSYNAYQGPLGRAMVLTEDSFN